MKNLPDFMCFEGFYIWFNSEKKEEYILTPNYLLGDLAEVDPEDFFQLRTIPKRNGNSIADYKFQNVPTAKYPFLRFTPTVEKFGLMLIQFLNMDFSDFINAYDNFYYMYGFELLQNYSKICKLSNKYANEKLLYDDIQKFHTSILKKITNIQKDFREAVDFLYNLNGCSDYSNYDTQAKFLAAIIKEKTNLYKYTKHTDIINYSLSEKAEDYENNTFEEVLEDFSFDCSLLNVSDIYSSNQLGDILFIILNQLVQNNEIIRTCQNCGKYFIANKTNEIYCDIPNKDGSSCRDTGAGQTYKKNLENVPGLLEYRRTYNKKFNAVSRNKENKQLKIEFDNWKKSAQAKVKEYKQGKITEDELYTWVINNKD